MSYRYMRRNPIGQSIPIRPILYVGAAWVAFKAAQGGLFGLPLQSLAVGLGTAGGLVSKATSDTIGAVYGPQAPVITTPGGIPAGSASGTSTATGATRLAPPAPGTATDLAAIDPAAGGFAWDGTNVYTIAERTVIGRAATNVEAAAMAKRWYALNG
jgi:hypothetical protein